MSRSDGCTARGEWDVVCAEHLLEDLRRCAALHGMAGIVVRKRICGLQRRPVRLAYRVWIAVRVAQPIAVIGRQKL